MLARDKNVSNTSSNSTNRKIKETQKYLASFSLFDPYLYHYPYFLEESETKPENLESLNALQTVFVNVNTNDLIEIPAFIFVIAFTFP